MRSAEDAVRHRDRVAGARPGSLPDRTRRFAGDIPENAPERAETGPACLERNFRDGQIGLSEQGRRTLDASGQQIPMRGHAERLLEGSREMSLGHVTDSRQPLDRPVLVRSGVHPILGAQQAAQEFRILVGSGVCHERGETAGPIRRA